MFTRDEIEQALHYMEQNGLIRLGNISGTWRQLHCPFHNNGQERRPSCGCSLEGEVRNGIAYNPGRWFCFACGASHPFGKGIKEILALKGTSIASHPQLEKFINDDYEAQTDSLLPDGTMNALLASYAIDNLKVRALNKINYVSEEELASYRYTVPYMYQRKLTDEIIEKYDVGFDANFLLPGRKKPTPCITFPVRDSKGRTLFIYRRAIETKFFNMPEGIEKPVYGIYELPPNAKDVIICESIFNALTCVAYGFNAVALFGTGTPHQMEQLKRLGVRSYTICLDSDFAGEKGVKKIKRALSSSAILWTMRIPPEIGDVNDCDYSQFMQAYSARE